VLPSFILAGARWAAGVFIGWTLGCLGILSRVDFGVYERCVGGAGDPSDLVDGKSEELESLAMWPEQSVKLQHWVRYVRQ
jgi:hypothetical protein